MPVVMGVSDCHLGHALARAQPLNALPLAGILVPAPHYIRPSQAGLLQWFTTIAERSAHPVIIYDIPYRTGVVLELATLRALAAHERIVAIKDCGGDAAKTQARSEEHTSELQSPCNLVCRLLLEKKKNKQTQSCHHK